MNSTPHDPSLSGSGPAPVPAPLSLEDALYVISHAPIPEGLEERVHAALGAAPGTSKVLLWPAAADPAAGWAESARAGHSWSGHSWMSHAWMRTAAAAAIVFVVAGGGWGVYSRVERPQTKVIVLPASPAAVSGGFSSAGAMRTPQTIPGPAAHPAKSRTARRPKKARPHSATTPMSSAHPAAASTVSQLATPVGK